MTILHTTTSTHPHPHAVRNAWIAVAASPVALVVVVALVLGSGAAGSWSGGALLAVVALLAPTIAIVEARAADRDDAHGAGLALAAGVVDLLLVVAVLALAVLSPVAVLVGLTISACLVLLEWGPKG